jgi:hypothetical protein
METWEYKSVLCNAGDDMETTLVPLGEQGWEAVGFAPVAQVSAKTRQTSMLGVYLVEQWTAKQYRVLLKRRKP